MRIAYNDDEPQAEHLPFPPPPQTEPELLAGLGVPLRGIPGSRDLMHHKYVVRDQQAVWTGSTNWTLDSWQREENVLVTVESAEIAAAYAHNFEELWRRSRVDGSGELDVKAATRSATPRSGRGSAPGAGPELSHRIASAIGCARAPGPDRLAGADRGARALHGGPGHLPRGGSTCKGVLDATQIAQVQHQWRANPNTSWKRPLLAEGARVGSVLGQALDPVGAGHGPRLHARQGHRRRRRRLRRLVQPLALGRDERRERAGDPQTQRWPTGWRASSTRSARATRCSPRRP